MWALFSADFDPGPVYHQAAVIMLQNVRSDGGENNE